LEPEFINVYIANQKKWIEDLVAKQIMFESRVQLAESRITKLTEQLEESENNYEALNKDYEQSITEASNLQKSIDDLNKVNGDLNNQAFHANQELQRNNEVLANSKIEQESLVNQITQLKCELEEKAKLNTKVSSKKKSEDSDESQQL
jgi:predicted  nucleic acid-binding Zn-ribbon protein